MLRSKKQSLQTWTRSLTQIAPFLHRHEDCRLDAAQCDDLRPFREARFQKLAEAGFGILNRPRFHAMGTPLASHKPSLLRNLRQENTFRKHSVKWIPASQVMHRL